MPKQPATQNHMNAVESQMEIAKRQHIAAVNLKAGEHEMPKEHGSKS